MSYKRQIEKFVEGVRNFHDELANCHPSLVRGQVWCRKCGATQKVDSAECLRSGWPLCCGHTMTIDSPGELEKP